MRTHLCTPLAALATVCAALMLSGCASPCARVKQRQDEILARLDELPAITDRDRKKW